MQQNMHSGGRLRSGSTSPRQGLGNRFAFLGDSTTIGATDHMATPNFTQYRFSNAWPTYATHISNGRIRHVANGAYAATTTVDMLANFDNRITPYAPTAVAFCAGTNDITGASDSIWMNTEYPAYKVRYLAIIAKILGLNATPIICTIIPNSQVGESRRYRTQQVNAWLRGLATSRGFPLVDFNKVLINPSNGQFALNMSTDLLHCAPAGLIIQGQYFWDTVKHLVPPNDSLLPLENISNNLLNNGLFLTDTLGVPTGWTAFGASGALVNTVDPQSDGMLGKWGQSLVTDTVARGLWQTVALGSNLAVGDRMAFTGRMSYTYTAGAGTRVVAKCQGINRDFSPLYDCPVSLPEGTFYREFTVPVGTTPGIAIYLSASQGLARFSQVGLFNLTKLDIPSIGTV